jgi:hypothetical protein
MSTEDDLAGPATPVSRRTRISMALLALAMALGVLLEEVGDLDPGRDQAPAARLEGAWVLVELAGGPPAAAGLARARLELVAGGELLAAYRADAPGRLPVVLAGRWRQDGEGLLHAFGESESRWSEATLDQGQLLLDPDPLALELFQRQVPARYSRASSD